MHGKWVIEREDFVLGILLNNILNLTKEEIENSKIEFNMQAGSGGQPYL